MADSVLKLKIDDREYNNKLRDAAKGMKALEAELRDAGKSFSDVDAKVIEYTRELGKMSTQSNTAKGKIGEMGQAFTELSLVYKRMTDQEKASPVGQAMAKSLEELKERTQGAKSELSDLEKELNGTKKETDSAGGAVDAFTSKLTLNIDTLKLLDIGLQAVNGMLDVVKDSFMQNEQFVDMWGATVESAESVYKGFLNALNNSDINGFLSNINSIVRAATEAYNALDALNTFNAFNQVNVEKARTGMSESIVDYREGNATKETVKAAGEAYKKELRERQKLERETYLSAIKEVAQQRGVNPQDLIKALSGSYGQYQELKATPLTGSKLRYVQGAPGTQGTYTTYNVAANERERLGEVLRQLNDTELQDLQAIGAQAERTSNEIAQIDKQIVRVLRGRQGGGAGGGGSVATKVKGTSWAPVVMGEQEGLTFGRSVNDVTKEMQRAQSQFNAAGDEIGRAMAKSMIEALKAEKDKMMNEGDVTKGGFGDAYSHDFGKDIKGLESQMKNADNLSKQGQDVRESWKEAAGAIGSVGNALAGLEDPGAKIIGTVGQAIAQIALGFAQATAADSKLGVFGWIAAVAGGLGTMISTISAIKSATGYANGGVVNYNGGGGVIPGNSYTGDNLRMIGVNSGEIIMNTAQQNNVANALLSRQEGGVDVQPWVDGEKIFLGMNNTTRRQGRGEIVTTSMLKSKGLL